MGLLDKFFGNKSVAGPQRTQLWPGYKTFTEYNPVFTSYQGAIHEQELTRAAIEKFATSCAKLEPELSGKPPARIKKMVATRPNKYTTWPAFFARVAAMHEIDATVCVVPVFAGNSDEIVGIQPLMFETAEILEHAGEPWVRFHFATGDRVALEMKYVAIVNRFQYGSDFFGEPNCLDQTMQLLHAQAQAEQHAIKAGSKIRFIAGVNGMMHPDDMKEKRTRFAEDNLGANNDSGLLIYDTTFNNVKQVEPQSWVIDPDEMERINKNVYTYFGTNEKILQNEYTEDIWGAYYEGKIEPFAVKLGEALTNMLFTDRMIYQSGTKISFSSNRLEYSSNASKRNMVRDCVDRGIMTINEGREVLQMPRLNDGDIRVIRGEYINVSAIDALTALKSGNNVGGRMPMNENEDERDLGGDDQEYKDSNAHEQIDE